VPRPRFSLAIVLLPALAACARPPVAVAEIAAAHPDATYEATATGCEWSGRRTVRRFDELSRAVAWGRQMAALAPFKSCDVIIDVVYGETSQEVYRVSRDKRGAWSVGPVASR
jgi:hypothetical protein